MNAKRLYPTIEDRFASLLCLRCDVTSGFNDVARRLMGPDSLPHILGIKHDEIGLVAFRKPIFPAAVIDCKAAIRFLRGNAETYELDRTRFAVVGGSAGANLAEMVAVTDEATELSDLTLGYAEESCAIQACVPWFGPTDFLRMDEQLAEAGLGPGDHNDAASPESRYMGGQITELDPEWVQKANPMTYIHPGIPPIYLQHGERDHVVPMMQSAIFAQEIERRLGPGRVRFEILEGADRADSAFTTRENMRKVYAFLNERLGSDGKTD